jgi:hypothetical protein
MRGYISINLKGGKTPRSLINTIDLIDFETVKIGIDKIYMEFYDFYDCHVPLSKKSQILQKPDCPGAHEPMTCWKRHPVRYAGNLRKSAEI